MINKLLSIVKLVILFNYCTLIDLFFKVFLFTLCNVLIFNRLCAKIFFQLARLFPCYGIPMRARIGAIHLLTMFQHGLSTILDRSRLRAKLDGACMVVPLDRVMRLYALYGRHVRQTVLPNFFHDNMTGST